MLPNDPEFSADEELLPAPSGETQDMHPDGSEGGGVHLDVDGDVEEVAEYSDEQDDSDRIERKSAVRSGQESCSSEAALTADVSETNHGGLLRATCTIANLTLPPSFSLAVPVAGSGSVESPLTGTQSVDSNTDRNESDTAPTPSAHTGSFMQRLRR